jgi:hypothetical protein
MDIQHAAVVWRLLFWHIRALNDHDQNWIIFSCFRPEDMHLLYRGHFSHGSSRAFSANRGVAGHPDTPGNASFLPQIKGSSPPRFLPHTTDRVFGCPQVLVLKMFVQKHLHTVGSALLQDTFLTSLNLH